MLSTKLKINCQDYDSNYIGQSYRKLSFRLSEHRGYVRKNCEIDFDNIKILDNEKIYGNRIFSEMVKIYITKNTLNKIENMAGLKSNYDNTINLLQKKFLI